jgi:hypothetical protein
MNFAELDYAMRNEFSPASLSNLRQPEKIGMTQAGDQHVCGSGAGCKQPQRRFAARPETRWATAIGQAMGLALGLLVGLPPFEPGIADEG